MKTETIQTKTLLLADRIQNVPKSFIREILKVAISPDIISFAGGLPNPDLFPVQEMNQASQTVFNKSGAEALQYSSTEGYLPLREYIADQYKNDGLNILPDNILITSGSQQGLDLIAKIFINEGDEVIIEEPGYLGAIQSFSVLGAQFLPVPMQTDGIHTKLLKSRINKHNPKLFYTVPAFQNPSGISYSNNKMETTANILRKSDIITMEDTPYKDIKFTDTPTPSFYRYNPQQTILLGSFSKTTVPGFRLGWMVAPDYIMDKLLVAKQAADLHTNNFAQRVLYQYLNDFDSIAHVKKISAQYGKQCHKMMTCIEKYFPKKISYTKPEGGMFLWVTLPGGISATELFHKAIEHKVAFVPGTPFYTNADAACNTLRLNFSNSSEEKIEEGIKRLGKVIYDMS